MLAITPETPRPAPANRADPEVRQPQDWETALEDMGRLKEVIDAKNIFTPLNQLQQRMWLLHWSLFVFFNHENGRNAIIDLFFQDRCGSRAPRALARRAWGAPAQFQQACWADRHHAQALV